MASHVYPLAKQSFLSAGINMTSATIKAALVTSGYTYSASDQFRSALGANSIALSGALSGKSVTNGVFDASDITLSAVAGGSTVAAIVGYVDTGSAATDNLLWFEDGFSLATNGGDITIAWDNGASKIFAL